MEACARNENGTYSDDNVRVKIKNAEAEKEFYLSIKSKYIEKYKLACLLANELLINIFEEYKRFCERRGIKINVDLVIRKEERFIPRK